MGFLLKAAFWLAVVIVLLPTPEDHQVVSQKGTPVDGTEAISVARDLVADMSRFCTRNPEACDTGTAAAQAFGVKAQHGTKMLYDYLEQFNASGGEGAALSAAQPGEAGTPLRTSSQRRITSHQGAVTHVQSIRIPMLAHGQTAVAPSPHQLAPQGTATASHSGLETSTWQVNPVAGLGNGAWRQPLTRAELSGQAGQPATTDAIGMMIRQSQ